MITMYDSIAVAPLRKVASSSKDAVAGYVDGRFADFSELVHAFPHDRHLSIAVHADDDADCLDVEAGDALVVEVPAWVLRQHGRGLWRPVVYASESNWPAIDQELGKAGIGGTFTRRWVAAWNNQASVPAGFDAHQFTDHPNGQNVDESVLVDDFFGTAPRRFVAQVELTEGSWSWAVRSQPFHTPPLG